MKNTLIVAAMLSVTTICAMAALAADEEKPKYTIKEVMKQGHAGKMSLVKKVVANEAGADEKQMLLEMYKAMAAQDPPRGEAANWKTKTDALVAATQGVIDNKDGAAKALETASNCAACHGAHKPKKN